MDCQEFRETFSDYVDAALDAEGAARVRGHLAVCSSCRRLERAYRAGVLALRALPALAPSRGFGARVVNRTRRAPHRAAFSGPPALAASLAAAVLVGVLVVNPGGERATRSAAAAPMIVAPGSPSAPDVWTDFVTVRVASDDDIPSVSPYPSFQVTDSFSAVRVRFDVAAVWTGR